MGRERFGLSHWQAAAGWLGLRLGDSRQRLGCARRRKPGDIVRGSQSVREKDSSEPPSPLIPLPQAGGGGELPLGGRRLQRSGLPSLRDLGVSAGTLARRSVWMESHYSCKALSPGAVRADGSFGAGVGPCRPGVVSSPTNVVDWFKLEALAKAGEEGSGGRGSEPSAALPDRGFLLAARPSGCLGSVLPRHGQDGSPCPPCRADGSGSARYGDRRSSGDPPRAIASFGRKAGMA